MAEDPLLGHVYPDAPVKQAEPSILGKGVRVEPAAECL
jgi:hypothetical protein